MINRKLGKIEERVSLLGFGAMRLPKSGDGIDTEQLQRMIDHAMAANITYYDTAYVYHQGQSEALLGELLTDRYPRSSFYVADKLPGWKLPDNGGPADMWELFRESKRRLHVDMIDFYLIHSLDAASWEKLLAQGVLDFLQELRASGEAGRLGFSFHDAPENLPLIAEAFDWDFAQIQLNYFDWQGDQNAKAQYEYLCSRDLPVIVMEPVRGGSLASLPEAELGKLREAGISGSPATLALRWAASLPQVLCVLSGMSSMEQMEENCAAFAAFRPLDGPEWQTVEEMVEMLRQRDLVLCTGCKYCVDGCPQKIDIPAAMTAVNDYRMLGNERLLANYLRMTPEDNRPNTCVDCGACVAACPQKLDVPAAVKELAENISSVYSRHWLHE